MSLRLRLFLLALAAILLSLAALLAVGGSAQRQAALEQLDARLCMEARRLVSPRRDEADLPERLLDDLQRKLRLDARSQLRVERQRSRHEGAEGREGRDGRDGRDSRDDPRDAPREPPLAEPAGAATAPGLAMLALDWHSPKGSAAPGATGRQDPLGRCEVAGFEDAEGAWRVARNRTQAGSAWLAASLAPLQAEWRALLARTLALTLPVALALAAVAAAVLAQLMMRPLNRLREAMRAQRPDRLDQRLPSQGEARELRELVEAYNTMLARLEASFHQASRFSADAAHELRTPLTVLQGKLERAIGAAEGRALQAELGGLLELVNRLAGTVRQLLLLSRADAGRLELQRERVDLSALLQDLVQDAELLADGRRLTVDIAPQLAVAGDALLLRQLFNNLLSNALAHGRPQGQLHLQAQRHGAQLLVRFDNDCAALDAGSRARLFDRFFRAPQAPGARREGSGLGLSLAREIARAHGGELSLLDSPAERFHLQVRLPAAP